MHGSQCMCQHFIMKLRCIVAFVLDFVLSGRTERSYSELLYTFMMNDDGGTGMQASNNHAWSNNNNNNPS
jgi:hypothetical protein